MRLRRGNLFFRLFFRLFEPVRADQVAAKFLAANSQFKCPSTKAFT
jgi:hypothetical protein